MNVEIKFKDLKIKGTLEELKELRDKINLLFPKDTIIYIDRYPTYPIYPTYEYTAPLYTHQQILC